MPGQSSYEGAAEAIYASVQPERHAPLPDALFGINDIMAMGAIDTLRYRLGLRVPEDLMVAGFDDILEAARLPYQLTTVRQPIDEMVDETLSDPASRRPDSADPERDRPTDRGRARHAQNDRAAHRKPITAPSLPN